MSTSDLIVLGIGPTADIPHLVLTGLNILTSASQVPEIGLFQPGVPTNLFTAASSEPGIASLTGILPGRANSVSWQVKYLSAITTAQLFLQFSLDGLVWYTGDTSTNNAGEIRQVYTAARFMRAIFGPSGDQAVSTTVTVVVKPITSVPTSF